VNNSEIEPLHVKTLCTARRRNGEPCKNAAMNGSAVCRMHGGAAPQVRRRAAQRILEASDQAAYRLVQMMQDKSLPPAVQLAAARDLLDRANLAGKQEIELDIKVSKFENVLAEILVDVETDEDFADVVDAEVVNDLPDGPTEEERDALTEERERARRKSIRAGGSGARIERTKVTETPPQEMDPQELQIIEGRKAWLEEIERGGPAPRRRRRIR
jgi:hypothetical protein